MMSDLAYYAAFPIGAALWFFRLYGFFNWLFPAEPYSDPYENEFPGISAPREDERWLSL